ncbi:MAG: glycosyltransferase family 4 protein [archaeon]
MKPKKKRIGVLGRSGGDQQRVKPLINIAKMLQDDFELDLIINSKKINPELLNLYNIKNYVKFKVTGTSYVRLFFNDLINLYRYSRKEKPDILFQYTNPFVQGPALAIMARLLRIKSVTRFSGSTFDLYKFRKGLIKPLSYVSNKWLMRFMFLADKMMVLGEDQKKEAIRNGCNPKKIVVLPQPVDEINFYPARFRDQAKKRLNINKDLRVILWVGNLKDYKGLDTIKNLIRAVNAKKQSKKWIFVVIGKDFDKNASKLQRLGSNVRYEGTVQNEKMYKYYQAADILLHTSFVEASIPNTIWEALACGTPCIGRDMRDIKKVADAVFKTDEELIRLVLKKGWKASSKSKVPKEYQWETLKKRYIHLFNEAVK